MSQYFHDHVNTIIQGDCLEVLQKFPFYCVDLVLTDPPYGVSDQYKVAFKNGKPKMMDKLVEGSFNDSFSDDEMIELFNTLAGCLNTVLKEDGSVLIFHDRGKSFLMKGIYDTFILRNVLAFIESNPPPHIHKNNFRSAHQQCTWYSREKYNLNFLSQREMKNVFFGRKLPHYTEHPTEKPAWMIEPLIRRLSNPGDLILDPFVGSGRVCVEAKKLGRRYIGIDINPRWCEVARKWLKNTPEPVWDFFK